MIWMTAGGHCVARQHRTTKFDGDSIERRRQHGRRMLSAWSQTVRVNAEACIAKEGAPDIAHVGHVASLEFAEAATEFFLLHPRFLPCPQAGVRAVAISRTKRLSEYNSCNLAPLGYGAVDCRLLAIFSSPVNTSVEGLQKHDTAVATNHGIKT